MEIFDNSTRFATLRMIYVREIRGNILFLNDKTYVRNIWIPLRYLIKYILYLKRNVLNLRDSIVAWTIVYLPTLGELFVTLQERLVGSGAWFITSKARINNERQNMLRQKFVTSKAWIVTFWEDSLPKKQNLLRLCGKFHYLRGRISYFRGKIRYLCRKIR